MATLFVVLGCTEIAETSVEGGPFEEFTRLALQTRLGDGQFDALPPAPWSEDEARLSFAQYLRVVGTSPELIDRGAIPRDSQVLALIQSLEAGQGSLERAESGTSATPMWLVAIRQAAYGDTEWHLYEARAGESTGAFTFANAAAEKLVYCSGLDVDPTGDDSDRRLTQASNCMVGQVSGGS